jgi:hypothetical protein
MQSLAAEVDCMVRPISFLLAFWLAGLFVVGQLGRVPMLLVYADGLAAMLAFLAGMIAPIVNARTRLVLPSVVSLGLYAIWLCALLLHTHPWLPWSNFIAVTIYDGIVIAELIWSPRNRGTMAPADS